MTAPDRFRGAGFASTMYVTDASPCPVVSPEIATQLASVVMRQAQSRLATMLSVPAPPVEVKDAGALVTPTVHLESVGAMRDVLAEEQAAPSGRLTRAAEIQVHHTMQWASPRPPGSSRLGRNSRQLGMQREKSAGLATTQELSDRRSPNQGRLTLLGARTGPAAGGRSRLAVRVNLSRQAKPCIL